METYSYSHLGNHALLRELGTTVSQHRTTTARMLAQIAEVDARKLYRPAGYASMYLYCVQALHMSEDMTCKRIAAARAARDFPAIFPAVAEGRLHLSGIVDLAPHLEAGSADELLAAAAHKTRAEIALLIAHRFPKPDVPTLVMAIEPVILGPEPAPTAGATLGELSAPGRIDLSIPASSQESKAPVLAPLPTRAKPVPLSPGKFALQVTVDQATHDQLRYAQALLGHTVPSGDLAQVLKRALDALVDKLERNKRSKSSRPRPQRVVAKGRHVPAAVRRAVWARDGGKCTFVGEHGKRCESLVSVELDHVVPVTRGGQTTVGNLRLLCRAHNQLEAERVLGVEFMRGKREAAAERIPSPTGRTG